MPMSAPQGPRARRRLPISLVLPLTLLGATGGPDSGDLVFTDSDEVDGPPHAMLDLSSGTDLDLAGDESVTVSWPFHFDWYGSSFDEAEVSADGGLFFSGDSAAPGACPGAGGDWSGLAGLWDDLGSGTIRSQTLGRYPHRVFAVDWQVPHEESGGSAHFQIWLTEGRNEAVIALDDLGLGGSASAGATAIIGAQGSPFTGLSWSCESAMSEGVSAWFGNLGDRPTAEERNTTLLADPWYGAGVSDYLGGSLAVGDVHGDGYTDLVVGAPNVDAVYVFAGGPHAEGLSTDDASTVISGPAGSDFGSAVVLADLDGDGVADIVVGAPEDGDGSVRRAKASVHPKWGRPWA